MKICFVAPIPLRCKGITIKNNRIGGIAVWIEQLWKYINSNSESNIEICYIDISTSVRTMEGNRFSHLLHSLIDLFYQERELKKVIARFKPDIIHVTTSGGFGSIRDLCFMKMAIDKHIPVVYHLHFGEMKKLLDKGGVIGKIQLKALRLAQTVITIDTYTHNMLEQIEVNSVYIPNLIDEKLINGYTVERGHKTVVFSGWVVKTKGIEELLGAWDIVSKDFNDWKLKILGYYSNEYYRYLRERFKCDNVVFEGEVSRDDVLNEVALSDICILPSYTEGFPNSILEAMLFEKAIIGTAVGAIPTMLDNECGIIIDKANIKLIESALRKLMEDGPLRTLLGKNARKKCINEYRSAVVTEKLIDIWKEAMQYENLSNN